MLYVGCTLNRSLGSVTVDRRALKRQSSLGPQDSSSPTHSFDWHANGPFLELVSRT